MANLTFSPAFLSPKNKPGDVYTFTAIASEEREYLITPPSYMEIKLTTSSDYNDSLTETIGVTTVSFSVRIKNTDIYDGGICFKDTSTEQPFEDEFLSIIFDIKNLLIVKVSGGYGDYYRKGKKVDFYVYKADRTAPIEDTFVYNANTATFSLWDGSSVVPKYSRIAKERYVQVYAEIFNADFTTGDIRYDASAIKGTAVEILIKHGVSLASIRPSWVLDTKTIFATGPVDSMGEVARTGSFSNDTIYFDGTQATTETKIHPDLRSGTSIKVKVQALLSNSGLDDVVINNLRILPSGIIYIGGDDA